MTQLATIKELPLQTLYDQINLHKNNPAGIFRSALEALTEVMDGTVKFVDPTNPTVMLLECAAVSTAAAVNENLALLRKQYPSLAETSEELYNHMADVDYINRFAIPGIVPFGFLFSWSTLLNSMLRDETEKCKKAIIPRDTEVIGGGITFTLQYPVVIRYYDTGTLTVSYDAEIISPLQSLETNMIPYETRKKEDGTVFIYFQIPLYQFKIDTINETVQAGRVFKIKFPFPDQFYYVRAFRRGSSTNNLWVEIKTTHSDLVFDRRDPTLVIKVEENILTATLPQIYLTEFSLLGEIVLHVYTSKGAIVENLEPFDFTIELRALNRERDLGKYTTESLTPVPRFAITNATITGGKDSLNFESLRKRVIYHSIGAQEIPITTVQLETEVDNLGFELIKNTDVTTNRIFLATQKLPPPSNPRLITSANIGIGTFITDKTSLLDHPHVYINNQRWTLTPDNLFKQTNGIISLLSSSEIQNLKIMELSLKVNHLNSNKYLYTPFHWVFDNNSLEFSLRAYHLDSPTLSMINFVRQNQSLELAVNTASRRIERTIEGYKLTIRLLSGNSYKALPDGQVAAQLMFFPSGDTLPVYIKGHQSGITTTGEREFSFDLKTNYDLDEENRIRILDASIDGVINQDVWVDLETELHVFLCTNSLSVNYTPDQSNNFYGEFQLAQGMVPITHESIKVSFGKALKNLWARARSLAVGYNYETYPMDIPLTYDQNVYTRDHVTGNIFTIVDGRPVFTVLHNVGEPVLDEDGNPVMRYRKGDPIINSATGAPQLKSTTYFKKEVDLLFIDGRHYFVNDPAYLDYNKEVIKILETWIIDDLVSIQENLLEKTKIFFHPKSQLGEVVVDLGDGVTTTIDSEQTPEIDLYVPEVVFNSDTIRTQLKNKTISVLDQHLSKTEINNSEIEAALRAEYSTAAISLKLFNLGGSLDLNYARVVDPDKRLSLKRILDIQADGSTVMKEAVTINFFKVKK